MFVWTEKQRTIGRTGAFSSVKKLKTNNKRGNRYNFNFSTDFLKKFNIDSGMYIMIGFDKENKRIGLAVTRDTKKGYMISGNGASSNTKKVTVTIDMPFEIDYLQFEKDDIFKENGIIIYDLSNKDIVSNFN